MTAEQLDAALKDQDPDWQMYALEMLAKLQNPVNQMIYSWNDWWLATNALGIKENWSPETNPHHMIRSEVSDIYKVMSKIRALENKLSGESLNSGTTNFDWNLLNSLKREVGIPVEFADDKKNLQKEGNVASKAMAAFN